MNYLGLKGGAGCLIVTITVIGLIVLFGVRGPTVGNDNNTSPTPKISSTRNTYKPSQELSVPEKLLAIARPKHSERSSVLRKIENQIPSIHDTYSDLSTQPDVGDKIMAVRNVLRDNGLDRQEPLSDLTNNFVSRNESY